MPLRAFLGRIGADLAAKYTALETPDDHPSSIDTPTALHPQTLLATEHSGEDLRNLLARPPANRRPSL